MTTFAEEPAAEESGAGLRSYLDVIRRRKWLVLAITVIPVALAVGLSLRQDPVYRAEEKIVIGQGRSLFNVQNGNAIQPFTATMSDLLQSNIVAANVIQNLGLKTTPDELLKHLSASINPQTAVITAHFDDHSKLRATQILNEFGLVFAQLVKDRFGQQPAGAGENAQPPITASVFDPAHVLEGRVSPKPVRNGVIALVLGLVLGLLAAFLREHFDRGLRDREAVERAFGLPVIGQIPFVRTRGKDERRVVWDTFGEVPEAYRGLRANLQYLAVQRPLRTILVTSASPQQGKTTVAANLAVAIARSGASVVAVEGDLRRPRLDEAFGISGTPSGVTNVVVGAVDAEDAVTDVTPAQDGARTAARLSFLPSGPLPPNPSELLSSAQMQQLLDRLSVLYDYVLIDSPPVLLVSDALELARNVDGVVLVVRRNHASRDEAREVRAVVERLGIHLVGVVLTDVEPLGTYGTYGEAVRERPPIEPAPAPAPAAAASASAPAREREPVVGEEV